MPANEEAEIHWPHPAEKFLKLFAHTEGRLKKRGDLIKGRKHAEADWMPLADALGADFFAHVRGSGAADMLMNRPPRKRMADLCWAPENPAPIGDVRELFRRGLCQVRNNLAHGEKFVVDGDDLKRDIVLIEQSLWALEQAIEKCEGLKYL
jgi:hypothetical protein